MQEDMFSLMHRFHSFKIYQMLYNYKIRFLQHSKIHINILIITYIIVINTSLQIINWKEYWSKKERMKGKIHFQKNYYDYNSNSMQPLLCYVTLVRAKRVFQTAGISCTKLNEKFYSIRREQAILIGWSMNIQGKE